MNVGNKGKYVKKKSNMNQGKIRQAVSVTSSKVMSFFLGGLTFGAPVVISKVWAL